jgi:hypothetical protein
MNFFYFTLSPTKEKTEKNASTVAVEDYGRKKVTTTIIIYGPSTIGYALGASFWFHATSTAGNSTSYM